MAAGDELVLSMLSAASSLQKLNERLDRISLHSDTSPGRISHGDLRRNRWQFDSTEALLLEKHSLSDSASESQDQLLLRSSHTSTSSKFDSAFGSQTEDDLISVHSTAQQPITANVHQSPRVARGEIRTQSLRSMSEEKKRKKRKRHHHHEQRQEWDTTSSPDTTPRLQHKHSISKRRDLPSSEQTYRSSSEVFLQHRDVGQLQRTDSARSLCSNTSNSSTRSSSSKILSLELSASDLIGMAAKSHSKQVTHSLSSAVKFNAFPLHQVHAEVHSSGSDTDTINSGASTPVLSKEYQPLTGELFLKREVPDPTASAEPLPDVYEDYPFTPEIVVLAPRKDEDVKVSDVVDGSEQDHAQSEEQPVATKSKKKVTIRIDSKPIIAQQTLSVNDDGLTSQPSPSQHLTPSLLHEGNSAIRKTSPARHSNAPKRRASILQRLRRRRGSFKSEKRPKRHISVKRSFSDRITYDIRKGWIHYEEDLEFISNPSRPRRVGRMIARKADTLHIVQLNRPPSGRYGIYISQTSSRQGIFISRFADSNAAKFYTGLLSPGDEIVRVNKEDVKDKSVDYVYDMLEELDTVIFSIVPVCSRPDW